ncbi:hypothetical protein EMCG_08431 [[Emmonsia] crescens]|uniref:Uncharacterized protein n=1 Tax=[Emmonsia] crescens TaxID=73230 RepID=A0A0G2JAH8_9EURO|nr:hypothetical protein EMCG_08431 [Emmonsia crescens UAMH 3008]
MMKLRRGLSFGNQLLYSSLNLLATPFSMMQKNKISLSGLVRIYRCWQHHWNGA